MADDKTDKQDDKALATKKQADAAVKESTDADKQRQRSKSVSKS